MVHIQFPKSVLITGASRGIGYGLVLEFLKHQQVEHVFAGVRNPDGETKLNEITDERLTVVKLNVDCDETIKSAVEEISHVVGDNGLNCLINNAGIFVEYLFEHQPDRKKLEDQLKTNLISHIIVSQHFLPLIQRAANKGSWGVGHAAIINISSDFGSISKPDFPGSWGGWLPYKVSKAALNQFSHTLADDLDPQGILVVSFDPGWVQTDMGGQEAPLVLEESCSKLVSSFSRLSHKENGGFFKNNGDIFPW